MSIEKENSFLTQVIVSKELSKENQKWLTLLSSNLEQEDADRTVLQINELTEVGEKRYGDSVLEVAATENEELFNRMKEGEGSMCEAIRRIFADELKEALDEALEKRTEEVTEQITKDNQQKFQEMIFNALKKGYTAEMISDLVGISLEEVQIIGKQCLQTV